MNLYLKQTISEKFIEQNLLPLLDTLCVTPYFFVECFFYYISKIIHKNLRGSKVKILLKMNNPQVTKAFNSLVGTSEAIRLLSILYIFQKKKWVVDFIERKLITLLLRSEIIKSEIND